MQYSSKQPKIHIESNSTSNTPKQTRKYKQNCNIHTTTLTTAVEVAAAAVSIHKTLQCQLQNC